MNITDGEDNDFLNLTDIDLIKIRENSRYHNWKCVEAYLPLEFDNGFKLNTMTMNCGVCNKIIYQTMIRGTFHKVAGGDYRLSAYGMCYSCCVLTPVLMHIRQREDGTVWFASMTRKHDIPIGGATIIDFNTKKEFCDGEENKNGQE